VHLLGDFAEGAACHQVKSGHLRSPLEPFGSWFWFVGVSVDKFIIVDYQSNVKHF